jgi:hypothetical protein
MKTYELIIYAGETARRSWNLNGKLHRETGSAVIYSSGTEYWYRYGGLHREDGPAITYANGACYWYINGVYLSDK